MLFVAVGRASFSERRELRVSEDDRLAGTLKPEMWSSEVDGLRTPTTPRSPSVSQAQESLPERLGKWGGSSSLFPMTRLPCKSSS